MGRSREAGHAVSELVPAEDIETIVGQERHKVCHYGRAVSAEETLYILHSHDCKDSGTDLRECEYSIALDRGLIPLAWQGFEDEAVVLYIELGRLFPLGRPRPTNSDVSREICGHALDNQGTEFGPSSPCVKVAAHDQYHRDDTGVAFGPWTVETP